MRFLVVALLLFWCRVASAAAVPPSPAGGGHFQIYASGDYAFVAEHDAFDSKNLLKNGFTIELWFYISRPLKALNTATGQPFDKWVMLFKADNYQLTLHPTSAPIVSRGTRGLGGFGPTLRETPSINQWHYVAIIIGKGYVQKAVNTQLWEGQGGFLPLENTDSPLCIGGGLAPLPSTFPGPFLGKPFWMPFTGGFIDEVRISDIVRYPRFENLKGTIKVPPVPFEPDAHTVALWHFDVDGFPGSKWRDASGNGHHLTYHGNYLGVEPVGKLATTWGELKSRR